MPGAAPHSTNAGVGTTVATIGAGLSQVVVPRGFDQSDTAAHVEALGDGPGPSVVQAATIGWELRRVLSEPSFP
jgi:UDP:flavonoid glycosyltransferase YjiC (YdhE family)